MSTFLTAVLWWVAPPRPYLSISDSERANGRCSCYFLDDFALLSLTLVTLASSCLSFWFFYSLTFWSRILICRISSRIASRFSSISLSPIKEYFCSRKYSMSIGMSNDAVILKNFDIGIWVKPSSAFTFNNIACTSSWSLAVDNWHARTERSVRATRISTRNWSKR